MNQRLDVYLQDSLAGYLEQRDGGELTFTYDTDYFGNASHGLSLSLPLKVDPHRGPYVNAFFSGLLPEEGVRHRLAGYLGLSENNAFALLKAVGGDCAGALAFYRPGEKPPALSHDVEMLDDVQLKEILALIKRRPMLAGDEGYRLSLAGAQDKLAVGFRKGRVFLIKGGAPTTHILKPLIQGIKESAHNELFCMKLAQRVGISVPDTSLHFVNDTPYYLVARYDRCLQKDGSFRRLHQEDFCQALGIPPEMKYEREGGPTIARCQDLIAQNVAHPAKDQINFLNRVLFNYLIGNADAHGKNFSLLYRDSKTELAPAYDLLSTAVYPDLSEKMAMKIGGKYKPRDVYPHHFYQLVAETRVAQAMITKHMQKIRVRVLDAAHTLRNTFKTEGITAHVFDSIIKVIEERAAHLKSETPLHRAP